MRLLLLNPNMSQEMTARMEAVARAAAWPGVEITALTATRGFPYISSRAEAQIAGGVVLEMIADHVGETDAVIIAAFGDPGLHAARELFDLPVVGLAEASLLTASMLGERFGVVTFTTRMRAWYADAVRDAGLSARFCGVRCPDVEPEGPVHAVADAHAELIRTLCAQAALEDGADAVILGGAPLTGLASRLDPASPVTLVDPVAAAVGLAEALARAAPRGARSGRFARPPAKASAGLHPPLADWIARRS